jgi:hypothetical protein
VGEKSGFSGSKSTSRRVKMPRGKGKSKRGRAKATKQPQLAVGPAANFRRTNPANTIKLFDPEGIEFSVELTCNVKVLEKVNNRIIIEQREQAMNFLNQVSQKLFQSTFKNLVPSQCSIAWNCIKECKEFGNFFLEALVLAFDSTSCKSEDVNNEMFSVNPNTYCLFFGKIFNHSSYLSMTITERSLLRDYFVKTNGGIPEWKNETNTKLMGILRRVEQLKLWPPRSILIQTEIGIDRRLAEMCKHDVERFTYLRNQQALLDFEGPYDDLNVIAQRISNKRVELEYKARLLDAEEKDPFTLDEAAYCAYLIPYNMLSPYAQCCAAR